MFSNEYFIVFPEGDVQEIQGRLSIGTLVDVNGQPMILPLKTNRCIAFTVNRISTKESRAGNEIYHYLELASAEELSAWVR